MAELTFKSDHNKLAFLGRAKGHEENEPMVDFLQRSKLRYALTHYPTIVHESLVKQFWATAATRSLPDKQTEIVAIVEGAEYVVTESLVRT